MRYHETFWVVVGAAAPVIGLACVLALGDTLGASVIFRRDSRHEPPYGSWGYRVAQFANAVGVVNISAQSTMIFLALESLARQQDQSSLGLPIVVETSGLMVLYAAIAANSVTRRYIDRLQSDKRPGPGKRERASE